MEYKATLAKAAFLGMLQTGRLDDNERNALATAFTDIIRQAKEVVLGGEATSAAISTTERDA